MASGAYTQTYTHTHTHKHILWQNERNYKKPGARRPAHTWFKNLRTTTLRLFVIKYLHQRSSLYQVISNTLHLVISKVAHLTYNTYTHIYSYNILKNFKLMLCECYVHISIEARSAILTQMTH